MRPSLTLLTASTYYQILGVPRHATKKEIKSKFYALSKLHHPDTQSSSEAATDAKKKSAAEFVKLSEAYSVLSNEERRKQYDKTLPADRSDVNNPRRAGWSMMERERKRQREWREKVSRQEIWNMRTAQQARTRTPGGGMGGMGPGGSTHASGAPGDFRRPSFNTSTIHNSPITSAGKKKQPEDNKRFFETHLVGSFFFVTGTLTTVLVTANVLLPVVGG